MIIKINGEPFILWRAADNTGHELDILLQKRNNKKAAIRFLSKLLGGYPAPRVVVTDKLRSYRKPIKQMMRHTEHCCHKRLNNRVESAHQPTRCKEKCLIKFKSPGGVQRTVRLIGKIRNIFSVSVGRYTNTAAQQRCQFNQAKAIWNKAEIELLCA